MHTKCTFYYVLFFLILQTDDDHAFTYFKLFENIEILIREDFFLEAALALLSELKK
jgi:hypothetical protein